MSVVIVDYGSGNLHSAAKAFERAAREAGLSAPIRVSGEAAEVAAAERVVLPGVGAFDVCRRGLDARSGMVEALEESVRVKGRPFLGICLGMQLMASRGLEHGVHEGLDWIAGEVVPLSPARCEPSGGGCLADVAERLMSHVPHMGWNELVDIAPHPIFAGIEQGCDVYFVHSYCFRPSDRSTLLAKADYGEGVAAAVGRDNMVGTQFHPEKSQSVGLKLIANFLSWRP
jgi:glutamine amidotransferase